MKALAHICLLATCLLCACNGIIGRGDGDDNRFSAFAAFPSNQWLYSEPVVFTPDTLRDTTAVRGTLLVNLRHTSAYPYRNIWLEVSTPQTDSTTRTDTLNIELADAFGRWHGRGSGLSKEITDTVATDFSVAIGRPVQVRHIMRVDTLAQIERIGIIFVPADE